MTNQMRWALKACKLQAGLYDLDPYILAGLIEQESSGVADAIRLEQGYYRRYVKDVEAHPIVATLMSTSFGLGQCMGMTIAAETLDSVTFVKLKNNPVAFVEWMMKYTNDPIYQIQVAAAHLQRHLKNTGSLDRALLRYNGGGDPDYPDKIKVRAARLKSEDAEKGAQP